MIFDLNVLIRYPNGTWDDTNAQDIILFAKGSNMNLDWQLGNGDINIDFLYFFLYLTEREHNRMDL